MDLYTTLIRGVPELLVIYLLFFSSAEFVSKLTAAFGYGGDDSTYGFIVGVTALGIISGAYSVEVVRGALASVPKGHIEAAHALGLSGGRIFRRIIAPQMLRLAVPGMNNVWQSTMKDTALISVVGLQELMRISSLGAGSTRQPLLFYSIAAVVYLGITVVSQVVLGVLERILNKSDKARA
jgi:octopine/nopaline transport system permease protein